jgi:hypothetical protein
MSLWERLRSWFRGGGKDEAAAQETPPEPETDRPPEERAAEHTFDRDSRRTGTYPS